MEILELRKQKDNLLNDVNILVKIKNKLYSNIDISLPMSIHEKELNSKIASIFSEINILVKKINKIKNN